MEGQHYGGCDWVQHLPCCVYDFVRLVLEDQFEFERVHVVYRPGGDQRYVILLRADRGGFQQCGERLFENCVESANPITLVQELLQRPRLTARPFYFNYLVKVTSAIGRFLKNCTGL